MPTSSIRALLVRPRVRPLLNVALFALVAALLPAAYTAGAAGGGDPVAGDDLLCLACVGLVAAGFCALALATAGPGRRAA